MLVVVVPVGSVPVAIMDVIGVPLVRDRVMPAAGPVLMLMTGVGEMRQRVLVIVPLVRRVRVPLVHVVDVPVSLHAGVSAARAVLVVVMCVLLVIGRCHCSSQLC